jgi:hypothetical protein
MAIYKRNGRIIGLSPVQDYKFRPASLHSMCLYHWISSCQHEKRATKKKLKHEVGTDSTQIRADEGSTNSESNAGGAKAEESSKSQLLLFLADHPLTDTHAVRCLQKVHIPNFVGNSLPRSDQGDREYYCSTMLTLFKPWRSGLDLKNSMDSWDETFSSHSFSTRQLDLMKNMNIRYECLDARDDFHAQMRQGASTLPGWAELGSSNFEDLDQLAIDDAINLPPEHSGPPDVFMSALIGKSERSQRAFMVEIRRMLVSLGWTDCNPDLVADELLGPPAVIQSQSPGQWKAAVASKRAEVTQERARHLPPNTGSHGVAAFTPNEVKIVDKAYMSHVFISKEWESAVADVSSIFDLNKEQECAFRIVANHACSPDSGQLKMNIAGMAGIGKTQVLKALVEFFERRKESHRLIIVAPTGSAAALLKDSTYHSMFGINSDGGSSSNIQLAQVKSRLEGVDYIFLDEVSMLSCRDMFLINARLACVMNDLDSPFGGLNMIFAGDFTQLPPVIGQEHVSLYSRTVGMNATSLHDQEAAIGKALWHQVTTVVILRQDMRQCTQSANDAKFHMALSNMRYKACTLADIAFLKSQISSMLPGRPNINEKQFRNVSIITNLNLQKDEVNCLGAQRFAAETNQELHDFFLINSIPSKEPHKHRPQKGIPAGKSCSVKQGKIPSDIQHALWEQPACANTKLIPAKLSICLNMPVMIRNNAATELCITKGQEAFVYGWDCQKGPSGKDVLNTLFVKLANPSCPIKLDGLPPNVVLLTKTTVTTSCKLPDDSSIVVTRCQIEALPNFAMTDYASQGKTRPYNVVDLSQSRSHQSYYTSLSRSATADGTLILNSIHPGKITGGASGALRQEFRELELLDDITTLLFKGKLPVQVAMGDRRNTLVDSFRRYKGMTYMPAAMHRSICWSKSDPFLESKDFIWKGSRDPAKQVSVDFDMKKNSLDTALLPCTPKKSSPANKLVLALKRKRPYIPSADIDTPLKKLKIDHVASTSLGLHVNVPIGMQWHNNSCAYDATVTTLFNIWCEEPTSMTVSWQAIGSDHLCMLTQSFATHHSVNSDLPFSLDQIRDYFRRCMSRVSEEFTIGRYTSVHSIFVYLLKMHHPVALTHVKCPNMHEVDCDQRHILSCELILFGRQGMDIQSCLDDFTISLGSTCPTCNETLVHKTTFVQAPPLLAFDLGQHIPTINRLIHITCGEGHQVAYNLKGVIYYANQHFTARVVTSTGQTWFHDGMFTGSSLLYDSQAPGSVHNDGAIMAIYASELHTP